MSAEDLVERLAAHKTLGAAPRHELEWLAAHGTLRHLDPDQVQTPKGTPPEGLFVVFSGRFVMFVDRGAGPKKAMEWGPGEVTGLLPYSRMTGPPGDLVAEESTEMLLVSRDKMCAMIHDCYEVTSILVHVMLDRSRAFTSSDLHDEKMISLGKLSAGLAHELNNPASAIERGASLLDDELDEALRATRALGAAKLTGAQLAAVETTHGACLAKTVSGVRSPVEQAEHEEAVEDWLTDHGLDPSLAESLADTAVTFESLDLLAGNIDGPALETVLRWSASACSVRRLASEMQDAATRIGGLVAAIKGFTHMDQAAVAAPLDVTRGLSNTVTVLKSKARTKSAAVVIENEPGLPQVRGFAGELNQIWANLIDNALDAIPASGRIEVLARRENQRVVVRIVDNGTGIPPQILERIFDPFFTTKPVGQGTGLGLDIVRRLVRHNDGEISVESQPGRTEFRVALPVAGIDDGGGSR